MEREKVGYVCTKISPVVISEDLISLCLRQRGKNESQWERGCQEPVGKVKQKTRASGERLSSRGLAIKNAGVNHSCNLNWNLSALLGFFRGRSCVRMYLPVTWPRILSKLSLGITSIAYPELVCII